MSGGESKSTQEKKVPDWVSKGGQQTYSDAVASNKANPVTPYSAGIASQYMTPYQQAVKDTTLRSFDDNAKQQHLDLATQAQQSRAFGGDRQGIAEAELLRTQGLDRAQIGANLDQNAYSFGYQDFNRVQNAPLQRYSALTGILQGTPTNQTVNTTNSSNPGLLGTVAGLGQIGASFYTPGVGWSDRRAKTDVIELARGRDGLGVYAYRYVGDDEPRMGVMADEVAEIAPHALGPEALGLRTVNLRALMEAR